MKIKGVFLQQRTPVIGKIIVINVEPVETIIRGLLASGKLEGEKPFSGLIIADVEVGKTSVIRKIRLYRQRLAKT